MSDTQTSFALGVFGFVVYEAYRFYSLRAGGRKMRYDLQLIACVIVLSLGAGLLAVFLVNGNPKGSFFVGLSSLSLLQMLAQTRHARNQNQQQAKQADSTTGAPIDDIGGGEVPLTRLERLMHRYFGHLEDDPPRIGI